MGKMLGAFADDGELDRPDLNKCPDCNCFFEVDNCPVCGKECPENMRAGNRPAVDPAAQKRKGGKEPKMEWQYSWWFILLLTLFIPVVGAIIGIILILISPRRPWKKVLVVSIVAVLVLLSAIGSSTLISDIYDLLNPPVDTSLSREEYISKCNEVTPEMIYRDADGYEGEFVQVKLRIVEKVTCIDANYNDRKFVCYLAEAEDGSDFKLIVRDCLIEDRQRFIAGDVITVYGQGGGEREVYDSEYDYTTAPCLNMAYVILE